MAATSFKIPEFENTGVDVIPAIASNTRSIFRTNKTKNVQWRLTQLRKLYWAVEDYRAQLLAALKKDLNKAEYESLLTEVDWVKTDCMFMIQNLETFVKDEKLKAPTVPGHFSLMKFRVRREPLGTALIIGPYNYPVQLTLSPLIGAIAAGCTAVVKPSELTPNCAMVLKEIIQKRLDSNAYSVVNGGILEVQALLNEKWDKIFFTGSSQVGTVIAKKAAETLTPVTLELGGRNPAFITKNANLKVAAKRLLWGKTLNAGQVCLSQNYVLIDKDLVPQFIEHLKEAYKESFPNGAKASPDFSRIVNLRHFHRLKKMLDETKGKIVMGGELDESELFIEPTAVLVNSMDDSMMVEESFGPIFSIYPVHSLDQALNIANSVHRTPLALYSFGSKKENERVINEMTSGGVTLNDSYFHGSVNAVPFGGVGDSGMGVAHGKYAFDTFSHARTIADTPNWADGLLKARYMPYDFKNLRVIRMVAPKPNFDRNGKVVKGLGYWLGFVLGLGAKGAKGALFRWLLLLAGSFLYQQKRS
ncbi:Aldehyde/histidinol dehydrogenase [Immersiella caudata]|uniref:Aldehyde dehydrogenase n=1 Tax=Immersiella caudata TaxID=314043 RepID=A0AA40BWH7_9PEZI|nr:Aldehyde/histidinol dehydrogenase [Immersiella caudata]